MHFLLSYARFLADMGFRLVSTTISADLGPREIGVIWHPVASRQARIPDSWRTGICLYLADRSSVGAVISFILVRTLRACVDLA